ncbi:DUF1648 domain-containing protein [Paenibacillus sp. NFR01]|uniref:DUF1648 domain-containing protein n=1 Tax=Paenibacillus sp. NFR01 TaxID=1566279 RepID=UPI0008B6D3E2|nr:DUF1648 domain-containing protein [Paenibacillus sp. NFR01]SEU02427.1 Protein of unknown function [Paenibacillus sp. NFR01]
MLKVRTTLLVSLLIGAVPLLLYFVLYSYLPAKVPIHYNGRIPDRFVEKSSFEVLLLGLLGWGGLAMMKLLHLILRKTFMQSYIQNIAAINRLWNGAILLVTAAFSVLGSWALLAMV